MKMESWVLLKNDVKREGGAVNRIEEERDGSVRGDACMHIEMKDERWKGEEKFYKKGIT